MMLQGRFMKTAEPSQSLEHFSYTNKKLDGVVAVIERDKIINEFMNLKLWIRILRLRLLDRQFGAAKPVPEDTCRASAAIFLDNFFKLYPNLFYLFT